MSHFKQQLQAGKTLFGTLLSLGVPVGAEVLSRVGFDWLWIDMEHAPLTLEQVQQMLQAKNADCPAFVRIPSNDEVWIKRVLDLGADGIIVPQVKTKDEAQRAVAASKYPPEGVRSAGVARAHGYGMDFARYVERANQSLSIILQIEHVEAVKNIDAIVSVKGVDALIIGPYDLSGSFGKLGEIAAPEMLKAMETVLQSCKKHGLPIGIFALQPQQAKTYAKAGYQLIAMGIDVHFMWTAAKAALEIAQSPKVEDSI
jgi:2-dehydro-3-deoxyglucarate aldolase/4-hydroxy-2-oxoheptanedioate aldolase